MKHYFSILLPAFLLAGCSAQRYEDIKVWTSTNAPGPDAGFVEIRVEGTPTKPSRTHVICIQSDNARLEDIVRKIAEHEKMKVRFEAEVGHAFCTVDLTDVEPICALKSIAGMHDCVVVQEDGVVIINNKKSASGGVTSVSPLPLEGQWRSLCTNEACFCGGQHWGYMNDKGTAFQISKWKTFLARPSSELIPFLIDRTSSTNQTRLHVCCWHYASEGELAVYCMEHVLRTNWFQCATSYRNLKKYVDQRPMVVSPLVPMILNDEPARNELKEYFLHAMKAAGKDGHTLPAIRSLNQQIESFNANRQPDMGISPIEQRVARIKVDSEAGQIQCFDKKGHVLLTLQKQEDGRFKGILKVKYHELAKPEGHSWGHVHAEFYLNGPEGREPE